MSDHLKKDAVDKQLPRAVAPNISAQTFFSRVPDGVWNLFSSWTNLDDYESLHHVIHKNKQCEAHWLNNLRKYAHRAEPLFDVLMFSRQ